MSRIMPPRIAIVGAGIVGLVLANQLARANIPVTLIEARELDLLPAVLPTRVSSLNLFSRDILNNIGVWSGINPSPFKQIVTWAGAGKSALSFDAADIGRKNLGFIVENRALIARLWEQAKSHALITLECPKQYACLADIDADFIIGADGGRSWVREQAGIAYKEKSYGQRAIVAVIEVPRGHQQVAFQHFLKTGPLGVLPLNNPQQVSIVWSADNDEIDRLMSLDVSAFELALSEALTFPMSVKKETGRLGLGDAKLLGDRHVFPLVMRHAKQYVKDNVILVGDAAHTIHPLAGQGVNLGLKDATLLASLLSAAYPSSPAPRPSSSGLTRGSINIKRLLRTYERKRKTDNAIMIAAMQAFHCVRQPIGFGLVNRSRLLKRCFMR